ncbi:hypothetical protein SRB5_09400 [Streptomyces sp. RB5]|uniref:Saposin B type region 2 domain-containing protein n=2 Tax=Streptomyces smaragdinus TaxID=2585196 RepID=A0A7K0CBJ3_9ACTN|nr:hypothetical protein [Streptomyces smaragdinus]
MAAVVAGAVMTVGFAAPAMAGGRPGTEPVPPSAAEALENVGSLCEIVPMDRAECENYLDTYADMVTQMIQQDLSPEEIVSALGIQS